MGRKDHLNSIKSPLLEKISFKCIDEDSTKAWLSIVQNYINTLNDQQKIKEKQNDGHDLSQTKSLEPMDS